GFELHVFDLASGKAVFALSLAGNWGEAVFSPDGRTLAAATGTQVVLVEVASGKPRLAVRNLPSGAQYVAFSPDGRQLVTAMHDTTALIWDLAALADKN